LPIPEAGVEALRFDYYAPRWRDGSTVYFWEGSGRTQRRWYAQGGKPLLTLPADIDARGRQALRGAGIPDAAWFVALHVREAGSKPHHADLHRVLNANVMDYLPAIEEITSRGGWVIRMGDPNMARLPQMTNVLDYCHSSLRADWMDVFIAARCRFMLGSSSGPAYIPPLYGVASVLTNWWPPAQRPWHPTDIFIPKMIRSEVDGRELSLSETLQEPFSYGHSLGYLREAFKVRVEDNAPEEIREAVAEMFDRLEGTDRPDAETAAWRDKADRVYEAGNAFGMGQLARTVMRRHPTFVG
jgi:putative glycosyltransferase (TIGR04372 family)